MSCGKLKRNVNNGCVIQVFVAVAAVSVLVFQPGCSLLVGGAAAIGTPTKSETKVPAEYNIAQDKDKKTLILVDQPANLNAQVNMRYLLTDATGKLLQERVKIPAEMLIDYDKLADFRSDTPDFSLLSPEKVGESLGAGLVLSIVVQECKFPDVGQSGYVGGRLTVRAELINVATGQRVWPAQEPGRIVNVGFESEPRGRDVAALRLSVDAARCIVRYLYDCPLNQTKVADEITDVGWGK